jgi:hypothetical protein
MDEKLRAELLERADRDQAARNSLPPDAAWAAPVDADHMTASCPPSMTISAPVMKEASSEARKA